MTVKALYPEDYHPGSVSWPEYIDLINELIRPGTFHEPVLASFLFLNHLSEAKACVSFFLAHGVVLCAGLL